MVFKKAKSFYGHERGPNLFLKIRKNAPNCHNSDVIKIRKTLQTIVKTNEIEDDKKSWREVKEMKEGLGELACIFTKTWEGYEGC